MLKQSKYRVKLLLSRAIERTLNSGHNFLVCTYHPSVTQPDLSDQRANFLYVEKRQWAKWASFLLMGKKFLPSQYVENVENANIMKRNKCMKVRGKSENVI